MKASILNTAVPIWIWEKLGTRDQLRLLALRHGIKQGRNKLDTCKNLKLGTPKDWKESHHPFFDDAIKFRVTVEVSL